MADETPDTLDTFTWTEIGVGDLDRAATFYGSVFGWQIEPFGDDYRIATCRGQQVAGLYRWQVPLPDGVRVYVSVADLEAALTRVERAGGTVEHGRTVIAPEMGWWADFRDVDGTLIGMTTANPER
ncbi:MAG: VOC family protein [Actinobacteria bacterium]|nr:VOC family protein [Actinomycetota bacterium]MCG2801005.1 VOC family protein [Cellulomonas sp.]